MTWTADILAAGGDEKFTLILAAVVVGISIVASIAQKIMGKRQEQEAGGEARAEGGAGPPPRPVQRQERVSAQETRFLRQTLGISEEQLRARLGGAVQAAPPPRADRRPAPAPVPARHRAAARQQPPGSRPVSPETQLTELQQAPAPQQLPTETSLVVVRLAGPQQARMAIIHHEIFSPPKALREGPEMWDL